MKHNLDLQKIPEIWETNDEKNLSVTELKKKYISFAHKHFICNPPISILNKAKNWQIDISRRVIAEWRAKSRTRERILAIQLLDLMIETAEFLETVEDIKSTNGIVNVSYFTNKCKINGKLFNINITIKKQKYKDRRFVYYYSATECA